MNGNSIKVFDREEIAQNFNDTDILRQFKDGSLSKWLNDEVGEDDVASGIRDLNANSPDEELIDAIVEIMGLDRKQIEDARMRISAQKVEMDKLEKERETKKVARERDLLPDYDKVPDRSIYIEKWKQAAESGDMRAQYNYGMCCENAYERKKWIEQSAEQGYEKALAQLEELNKSRTGNPINRLEFCRDSQEMLNLAKDGIAYAQYVVGKNFYYGENGYKHNVTYARKWLQKAADQGYGPAIEAIKEFKWKIGEV